MTQLCTLLKLIVTHTSGLSHICTLECGKRSAISNCNRVDINRYLVPNEKKNEESQMKRVVEDEKLQVTKFVIGQLRGSLV